MKDKGWGAQKEEELRAFGPCRARGRRSWGSITPCDNGSLSFQDNPHNLKKLLKGLWHLQANRVWYNVFQEAAAILLDAQDKWVP